MADQRHHTRLWRALQCGRTGRLGRGVVVLCHGVNYRADRDGHVLRGELGRGHGDQGLQSHRERQFVRSGWHPRGRRSHNGPADDGLSDTANVWTVVLGGDGLERARRPH